jgi:hypothetical protein
MTQITITIDEQVLARARELAQAEGLSVEEWLHLLIRQGVASTPHVKPRDPLFGIVADDPDLADAIDDVVGERFQMHLRSP